MSIHLRFLLRKNACWGAPKPAGDFWTPCPEVPLSAVPSLPLLGLILPPSGQVEEVVDVGLDRHRLPHFLLCRPVLSVEFFLPLRLLPALLFQRLHPGELGPVQNVVDYRLCRPVGGQRLLMLRQILLAVPGGLVTRMAVGVSSTLPISLCETRPAWTFSGSRTSLWPIWIVCRHPTCWPMISLKISRAHLKTFRN